MHELRRLLGLAGFPEPVAVEPMAETRSPWAGGRFLGGISGGGGAVARGGRRRTERDMGVSIRFLEEVRGQRDLFGRELMITRKAVADNLVSAAQVVMGEGDEGIQAAIIRDAPVQIQEVSSEMPTIPPEECMYIGSLRRGPLPCSGGYDELIKRASRGGG
ncbi:MAG: coenzyme F420-0:L-glutamate ligase [Comamonadaceae bacterium]|nr:coenzyme F420-0:L-glutamate ligase [Comamonadaceae bacterium]